jgi:hypothetical protein
MNATWRRAMVLALIGVSVSMRCEAQNAQRQEDIAKRGAEVMPFAHMATMHVFTKTADGGTMRIVAKDAADAQQISMVRAHLQYMRGRFEQGDYSGPAHIHGNAMPGLADLKAAKLGEVAVSYREMEGGAELQFRTADAKLLSALHEWFDAQLSDHGKDAVAGH